MLDSRMILFLHGQDDFLISRRKRALVEAFTKKYAGGEVFVFDFEDARRPEDVRRALDACGGGLFATEKMIVFLHPLALEETAQKQVAGFLKEEAKALPERTILLFVETGKWKKSDPLAKALMATFDKEEVYDPLTGPALGRFVDKELALFNPLVRFDGPGRERFLALLGENGATLLTELEKLATFRKEGVITREDVELLIARPEEEGIWQALDALGRGNQHTALLLFRREGEKSEGVYPVLSMCAWQVRRLLLVREAWDKGIKRPADIVSATKLPSFTVQKALSVIEHLTLPRLKRGLALLSDIDTNLKQGKADPEVSLDLFVWKF